MKILIDMKTSFNLISKMYFHQHSTKAVFPNDFDILVSMFSLPS